MEYSSLKGRVMVVEGIHFYVHFHAGWQSLPSFSILWLTDKDFLLP